MDKKDESKKKNLEEGKLKNWAIDFEDKHKRKATNDDLKRRNKTWTQDEYSKAVEKAVKRIRKPSYLQQKLGYKPGAD